MNKQKKKRLLIILILFTLLFIALLGRILWLQVIDGEWYKNRAHMQQVKDQIINPKRGMIYDRNGKELAVNLPVKTISVNPILLGKSKIGIDQIAQKLSEILQMDKADVQKILQKSAEYVVLKRKVKVETSDTLKSWATENKLNGIYFEDDIKRIYPNNSLAAQVIGFTGTDNQGLSGVELSMDKYLKGEPGIVLNEVDRSGVQIPFVQENHVGLKDGLNVVLTIDENIQAYAENALQKAIDDNKVLNGGSVIVMDPRNGEVLAMASKPDFNLNNPFAAPSGIPSKDSSTWNNLNSGDKVKKLQETVWKNKAIESMYEPGSTFKTITAAAGLEEATINPNTQVVDTPIKVAGWTINSDKPGGHGKETFSQSIYNSDNPVFVKLAQSLGIDRFYNYVRAFGFNDKTGINLPGEAHSIFQKSPAEIDMATASFGQNFQITPIQLITAYAAIANGGKLLKPHLIKNLTNSEGNVVLNFSPESVRNVISRQTCDTLKELLVGVVDQGTGINAYVSGYNVAGKTGTAETFQNGRRSKDRFIASFSAFAPADNPVINVLVVLDYPSGNSHMGGVIAAPVAASIIDYSLNYLGVERKYTDKDIKNMTQVVNVPDVTNKKLAECESKLTTAGLKFKIIGSGNNKNSIVANQAPKPNESLPENSVVILYTNKGEPVRMVNVPDVSKKTVSEATQTLNNIGLNIKVNGTGNAVRQEFKAGSQVPVGKLIEVDFLNAQNSD